MKMKSKLIILIMFLTLFISNFAHAEDVTIEASKQSYDGVKNVTVFEGDVVVKSQDITVKSPRASVKMNKEGKPTEAVFHDNAYAEKDRGITKNEIKSNKIKLSMLDNKVKAEGDTFSSVLEGKKPIVTIKADFQQFDMDSNVMSAAGNVQINHQQMETHSDNAKILIDDNGDLKQVSLKGNANHKA